MSGDGRSSRRALFGGRVPVPVEQATSRFDQIAIVIERQTGEDDQAASNARRFNRCNFVEGLMMCRSQLAVVVFAAMNSDPRHRGTDEDFRRAASQWSAEVRSASRRHACLGTGIIFNLDVK